MKVLLLNLLHFCGAIVHTLSSAFHKMRQWFRGTKVRSSLLSPSLSHRAVDAIVLNSYGGYDKMEVRRIARISELKHDEVIVRVQACGMNFTDLLVRQGVYTLSGLVPPFVMGLECAGVVELVGNSVNDLKIGDRVMCWSFRYGMWCEVVSVPRMNCLLIPSKMTFVEAASFPIQFVTAYFSIMEFGNLRSGQSLLIHSAGGGVGWAATQLARTVEDVTIYGTASAKKLPAIKGNGVHHPIDYRNRNFVEEVQRLTNHQGVDIVLDCLAGSDFVRAQKILKPLGRIVAIGVSNFLCGEKMNLLQMLKVWWATKNVSVADIIMNNRSVCGLNIAELMDKSPDVFRNALKKMLLMYERNQLKPKVDSEFYFADVVEATKRISERRNVGKVVLVPKKDL